MLDRSLSSVLEDLEKKNPLQVPPVEKYRFAEPDSPENIVFEGSTIKVTRHFILIIEIPVERRPAITFSVLGRYASEAGWKTDVSRLYGLAFW